MSQDRISHVSGTPYEIGRAMGARMGSRLGANIAHYVERRLADVAAFGRVAWRHDALAWMRTLPLRYREEFQGLADGAGLPLQRVAEWPFVETALATGCSSALVTLGGHLWVARNNDFAVPELWGYAGIKEIPGRIPTVTYGMEGDVFAGTGINRERLWLHYHYLPTTEAAPREGSPLPCYVFLVEALETCRTLNALEALLASQPRSEAMLLFAVEGARDAGALYECGPAWHHRYALRDGQVVGTNHSPSHPAGDTGEPLSSVKRYARLQELIAGLSRGAGTAPTHTRLARILADDGIERRGHDPWTVYANVACPATGENWYTFGGHPAASRGLWEQLPWPW